MAEHTPGPWEVIYDAKHPLNKRITSRAKVHIAKVYATALNVDGGCEANARLIAAAPNLLAACKAALEGYRKLHQEGRLAGTDIQKTDGVMDQIHAAIREAKEVDNDG